MGFRSSYEKLVVGLESSPRSQDALARDVRVVSRPVHKVGSIMVPQAAIGRKLEGVWDDLEIPDSGLAINALTRVFTGSRNRSPVLHVLQTLKWKDSSDQHRIIAAEARLDERDAQYGDSEWTQYGPAQRREQVLTYNLYAYTNEVRDSYNIEYEVLNAAAERLPAIFGHLRFPTEERSSLTRVQSPRQFDLLTATLVDTE